MYWISQWSLRLLVDYLTCDKTRLWDHAVTIPKNERRRGGLFLAQAYLNIWSFLSHRCQLIINTGQLRNKVGFSFLPKLQIIGSCSLTSKYKIAGFHFKCHILSLRRSRAHLRNPAIVSDGQWHQQTVYCQHPGWQMTITMPPPPGIWAMWDPVSHSQLVPHLQLRTPGFCSTACTDRPSTRTRLFSFQGRENQTGNPFPWDFHWLWKLLWD